MTETNKAKVYLIDDDESVRRGITLLLKAGGYDAKAFASAEEFLQSVNDPGPGCILLDIFLEGASGLDLQEKIAGQFQSLPIIYITGQGNIPMSVQALKKGAVNFLQKPIDEAQLYQALNEAISLSLVKVNDMGETAKARLLFAFLTPREKEIFRYLITGMLNKQIAGELNIAEHTVKLHRGKITDKLGMKSIADLVHFAMKLDMD